MKQRILFLFTAMLAVFSLFAQSGKNIEFDGASRYMTIPHHEEFNFSTTEDYTITLWLNVNSYVANARFVSKRAAGNATDKSGYELWGSNSATNFYALNTPNPAGANTFSAWGTISGSTGNWIHLAFVVSGSGSNRVVYQYQNGEVAKSSTQAGKDVSAYATTNSEDVMIGKGSYGGGLLNGKIDNLRFYQKALSKADIAADMTATVTSATDGLVAAYDFETVNGTTVADITGNHPATLYNFPTAGNVAITEATVIQDINFTGRGNDNEEILKIKLNTSGTNQTALSNLKLKMTGTTDINDVKNIKIYTTKTVNKFDQRNPTSKGAVLLGRAIPAEGEITINTEGYIYSGTNYIWVTYHLENNAIEGNKVDAEVVSLTTENETFTITSGNPIGNREIMLARTLVLAPGDYGSANYRIPAITTADDGALVAITDKRKNNSADLPQDIDIISRRSVDGGKTWSTPATVAIGTGYGKGYGDAVVMKAKSGKLVALYVGGPSLWSSTPTNPMRTYMSVSTNNGVSWTRPHDITPQIYGAECTDTDRSKWQGLFFGSGHGLCTRSGRLMAVVAVRVPGEGGLHNYAVYSDDEGETWEVSNRAITGGDEAKVVELNNGDILISSRTAGNRLWAKSTDGGSNWGAKNNWSEIWGNACDADIVRFTSTKDGFDKNRILHTLPNASNRRNVTMWISYDETTTWPVKKTICPGESAYSSITILPDGTIGVYLEEDESAPYKMYFLNFSLDWLTDGADSYTPAGTEIVKEPLITPAGGRYGEPQTITITSETEGAKIYYTTDGSTPNTNAMLYTAPFEANRSMTIKALATKDGMANSTIVSQEYTIGWLVPGENRAVGDDRYVVTATTEGANVNLNYAATTPPASHYVFYNDEVITAEKGSEFTLKLEGLKGQGDGLQWCQAIILADWNRDYTFTADERIAIIGNRVADNGATTLSISQKISVPNDANATAPTRLRVVYTDGWRPNTYDDLGEDPVDKGRIYDFELKIDNGGTSVVTTNKLNNFEISTNMVKDNLSILFDKTDNYTISIFNIQGKNAQKTHFIGDKTSVNMSNFLSGIYLVKIADSNGHENTVKVVKQ